MWKKIIGYTLLVAVALAGGGFAYLYFRKPASQPPSDIRVAMTEEQVARGKYLFALADCDGCHTPHDPTKLYMPAIEAKRGSGQLFEEEGAPAPVYASNITTDPETGIGSWTDGEKIRAIREGIGRDGRVLFPMMPYEQFRYMSDEDVQALVAYLNTLPPVRNKLPRTTVGFPISMLIKGKPRPVTKPVKTPPRANQFGYGEYLTTVGLCEVCHTPFDRGTFDTSKRLAGGHKFSMNGYTVVSANITPDPETGIGTWDLDYFLGRFRRHRDMPVEMLPVATKEQFTVMPWRNLSQMRDDDLAAIYTYLMSRTPIKNKVVTHPFSMASR
jgi:mono/diheme cytochrome c family protein